MSKFDMVGEGPVGGGKVREYRMGPEQNREFRVDANFKITDKDIDLLADVDGIDRITRDGKYCLQVVIGEMFEVGPALERFRAVMDQVKESNKDKKGESKEKKRKRSAEDEIDEEPAEERRRTPPWSPDDFDMPSEPPTRQPGWPGSRGNEAPWRSPNRRDYPWQNPGRSSGDGWRNPGEGPRIRWDSMTQQPDAGAMDRLSRLMNPEIVGGQLDSAIVDTGAVTQGAREIQDEEDRRVEAMWDRITGGPLMDVASIRLREAEAEEAAERLRVRDEEDDRRLGLTP